MIDRAGEGSAEAAAVRAAIGIRNGIRVAEELLVVGVRVVEADLDHDLVARAFNHDRLRVNDGFVLDQAANELFDALGVNDLERLGIIESLVEEGERQRGVDVGQVVEAGDDALGFELDGLLENFRVRHEGDQRAGLLFGFHLGDDMEALLGDAALERHRMDIAIAGNLDFEPFGNGIHALGSHAVGAAGVFVISLAVFAARVEAGEDEFHAGNAFLFVDVDWNAAAVVADGDRAIRVDGHIDVGAMAGEKFVHRVVKHLADAVVESALIGAADIHAGLFANGLEALERTQVIGSIVAGFKFGSGLGRFGGFFQGGFGIFFVRHRVQKGDLRGGPSKGEKANETRKRGK